MTTLLPDKFSNLEKTSGDDNMIRTLPAPGASDAFFVHQYKFITLMCV